ncbi:hypothetical protein [Clostridium sp. B9]|uniref:hypothetical protein n=1 Tax=Clostridium sp. B9 TaxID=3423224 RepID=UPI003D2F3A8C
MDIVELILNLIVIALGVGILIKGDNWIIQKAKRNPKEYTEAKVNYMLKWQKIFCIVLIINAVLGVITNYLTSLKTIYRFMTLPFEILLLVALFKSNFASPKIK